MGRVRQEAAGPFEHHGPRVGDGTPAPPASDGVPNKVCEVLERQLAETADDHRTSLAGVEFPESQGVVVGEVGFSLEGDLNFITEYTYKCVSWVVGERE